MLQDEIARIWSMREMIVIPVVVGALGAIPTDFEKYIAPIGIEMRVEHAKNSFIGDSKDFEIGTRILRKKHHYKYSCASLCETFGNRLLSALTESAGETNVNALRIIEILILIIIIIIIIITTIILMMWLFTSIT